MKAILVLLLSLLAFACGPSSGELKAAKTAHYKGDKIAMFNATKDAVEAKYKLQKSDENALGMQTTGRWYTPEGLAASERSDDMRDVPDNSLNIALVVTLVPDGDSYVVNVKPLLMRYHAGSPQPEPLKEDDASLPGWVHGKVDQLALEIHTALKSYEVPSMGGVTPAGPAPAAPAAPAPEGSAAAAGSGTQSMNDAMGAKAPCDNPPSCANAPAK
ncbi:MAG TPA: hypothetical protein VLT45_09645 [Kofleriaceae bacterium]|nr:hypothetical protein [Kofleriaceae bacterium]